MIKEEKVIAIGKIFKPHGYKGEMNVDIYYDERLFEDRKTPFFIKIDNILVPFFVERIGGGPNGTSHIKFKSIDSDIEALRYAKKEIFTLKAVLASTYGLSEDEIKIEAEGLEGYVVKFSDKDEILGTVTGEEEGIEYDYLVVEAVNDKREIKIPIVDEFIEEITAPAGNTKGIIKVNLPDGYLEI